MPTITRWFKVSHDINGDPEMWELRDTFGDRAAFVWLECLSIADRNKGLVGQDTPQLHAVLASKCRVYSPKVRAILVWCLGKGWLELRDGLRIAKWAKYNKTRDVAQLPSYTVLDNTDKTTKDKNKIIHVISPENLTWPHPQLLIEKYNRETPDSLAAVEKITPARLRKARDYLKIFPDESFWSEAFQEIGKSDFLLGLRGNNGHESFKANFDWLLTKGKDGTENVVKVFEGRYRNGQNQGFRQYR